MYTPPHFREDRPELLHDLIGQFPLATLIVQTAAGMEATHVPLRLENGVLRGHVASANPIAGAANSAALAIFQGPQFYVSPSWYASKAADPRVVPTWNYIAVHAHGILHTFMEKPRLLQIVTVLTEQFENTREEPWSIHDAPPEYIDKLLTAITGIEIPIDRLEGKWKMSQNRPPEDRASVAAARSIGPLKSEKK